MKILTTLSLRRAWRGLIIIPVGVTLCGCSGLATRGSEQGPFLRLVNGQAASFVIGQKSLTATDSGNEHFMRNWCEAEVIDGKLIIPDSLANRFWVFSTMPHADGAIPDAVIGQNALADGNGGARPFETPTCIQKQGDHYYVATNPGVISIWNTLPTGIHAYDDQALITVPRGTDGLTAVGGKLIASSRERIFIWNSAPLSATTVDSADIVLTGPGGGGAPFNCSYRHWTDGKRLLVADLANHRILIWNTFPTSSTSPADFVLGQPDMTCPEAGCPPGTSAAQMSFPYAVISNGIQIFVSDSGNSRVLVWNSFPTANNAPADVVLGQADFTSTLYMRGGNKVTAETLGECNGLGLDDHKLFVGDGACVPEGPCFFRWLVFESK